MYTDLDSSLLAYARTAQLHAFSWMRLLHVRQDALRTEHRQALQRVSRLQGDSRAVAADKAERDTAKLLADLTCHRQPD